MVADYICLFTGTRCISLPMFKQYGYSWFSLFLSYVFSFCLLSWFYLCYIENNVII